MTRLVVVGTGGMGREALAWLEDAGAADRVVGFLDEDPRRHGQELAGQPVLGGLDWLSDGQDDVAVVLAVGAPAGRLRLLDRLDALGAALHTVVHPTAVVGPRVEVGDGSIVCPGAILTCDVALGRAVIVNYGAAVGHDGRIGDGAFLAPGVHLAGTVTVERGADVGIGASVIQGRTVGAGSVVGAGAVVVRDVPAGVTAKGVPARWVEAGA